MLSFNLTPIFKIRGITRPFNFLVKAGLSRHTATRLVNNQPSVLRLDHVEFLCRILICEPNDLLLWIPEKDQQYAAGHPLFKLREPMPGNNWQEIFAAMPLKQLTE